jgi:hypothetical protein
MFNTQACLSDKNMAFCSMSVLIVSKNHSNFMALSSKTCINLETGGPNSESE